MSPEKRSSPRLTYRWTSKVFWSLSSRLLGAALSSAISVVLARAMAKDDVGLFFWSLSICWGGATISQWGSTVLAVKWIASARAQNDDAAIASAAWSLIAFTFIHALLLALLLLVADLSGQVMLIWGLWIFSIAFQNLLPELVRGFDDIKWASLLSGPVPQGFALLLLGGFWLWRGHLTFQEGTSLVILAGLIASIFGFVLLGSRTSRPRQLRAYIGFLVEGTPIALSILASYVFVQADLWLCGILLGKEQLAVYGIAQRMVVFVSMPLMVLGAILTPTLAELLARGERDTLQNIVRRATLITSALALAVLVAGALVGRPAISLLLGHAYVDSYVLFLILGAGQVFHAMAGPNGYILLMAGEQRVVAWSTLVGTLLLVAGGWLAGQAWGTAGIALASATCLAIQTVWMWLAVRWRLGLVIHFDWHFKRNII
jgi:O-antigen/teichoic acid export membrane protein